MRAFINSPTGPRTTHFWGPVANWGFVLAVRRRRDDATTRRDATRRDGENETKTKRNETKRNETKRRRRTTDDGDGDGRRTTDDAAPLSTRRDARRLTRADAVAATPLDAGLGGHEEARVDDQRTDDGRARRVLGAVHAVRVEGAAEELHPARVSHGERERAGV